MIPQFAGSPERSGLGGMINALSDCLSYPYAARVMKLSLNNKQEERHEVPLPRLRRRGKAETYE